jgi:protein involved in polysaccharide export with SLBB domain
MFLAASLLLAAQLLTISRIAVGQSQRDDALRVGDRVVVLVRGEKALSDTFVVSEGVILKIPTLPDLQLAGVQRWEVGDRVKRSIAALYRETDVQVTPLVRIGVIGQVARPGYYQVSADVPLSDAMMLAGGPTATADPARTIARRGSTTLWESEPLSKMLAAGATLSQLNLHTGDDIVVQERSRRDWTAVAQVATATSSLIFSVLYLVRR